MYFFSIQRPAANNQQVNMNTLQRFDQIRGISQPLNTVDGGRPPPYAPAISGNSAQDATLFHHASAPHVSTSVTLQRDLARQQGWGPTTQNDIPPAVPNTPRPNTLDRPADTPPEPPTTPRPNTLNRQADNPPEVPTSPRPSLTRQNEAPSTLPRSTDPDDHVAYVEPNTPTTDSDYLMPTTTDPDYLMPTQSLAPGEYVEPIADDPAEYNYAYDHDINSLARNEAVISGGVDNNSYNLTRLNTNAQTTNGASEDEETVEYNYAYDHEVESLSQNQRSANKNDGISYY